MSHCSQCCTQVCDQLVLSIVIQGDVTATRCECHMCSLFLKVTVTHFTLTGREEWTYRRSGRWTSGSGTAVRASERAQS